MYRVETWAGKRQLTTSYRRTRQAACMLAQTRYDQGSRRRRERVTATRVYNALGDNQTGGDLVVSFPVEEERSQNDV